MTQVCELSLTDRAGGWGWSLGKMQGLNYLSILGKLSSAEPHPNPKLQCFVVIFVLACILNNQVCPWSSQVRESSEFWWSPLWPLLGAASLCWHRLTFPQFDKSMHVASKTENPSRVPEAWRRGEDVGVQVLTQTGFIEDNEDVCDGLWCLCESETL